MIKSKKELYELLSSVFPTRENGFGGSSSMPKMPYINYYYSGSDNVPADNRVHARTGSFRVELYSKTASASADRSRLERALTDNDIYFESNESPLKEYGAVMSSYEITIYVKESEEM